MRHLVLALALVGCASTAPAPTDAQRVRSQCIAAKAFDCEIRIATMCDVDNIATCSVVRECFAEADAVAKGELCPLQ